MQDKDKALKEFFSDNKRFAALCNTYLFKGKKVIQEDKLTDFPTESSLGITQKNKTVEYIQRNRDVVKLYDHSLALVIIGIENQQAIDYTMPARMLVYDALAYQKQLEDSKTKHKRDKDLKKAEFTSKFAKTEKLIPVISIVIYYGAEPWDGAKTLRDMLNIPEELEEYKNYLFPEYKMHLLEVQKIKNLQKYPSDLLALFAFFKYQLKPNVLQAYVMKHKSYFKNIPNVVYRTIAAAIQSEELLELIPENEEEVIEMDNVITRLINNNIDKGLQLGLKKGRNEGIKLGRNEGVQIGLNEEKEQTIIRMIGLNLPDSLIMESTDSTMEMINSIRKKYNK